jgi:Trp operon repressor
MVAQIAHSLRHVHQTLNIKIDIANRGINELKTTTRRLQENTRDRPPVEGAADACT